MSVKISELPASTEVKDGSCLPIVTDNETKKLTYALLKQRLKLDLTDDELSLLSNNPVANSAVTAALDAMQGSFDNLAARMDEVFRYVSSGKSSVASAITDKGVTTRSDATFATMANNIRQIQSGGGINSLSTVDGDTSNHIDRIYSESEVV